MGWSPLYLEPEQRHFFPAIAKISIGVSRKMLFYFHHNANDSVDLLIYFGCLVLSHGLEHNR